MFRVSPLNRNDWPNCVTRKSGSLRCSESYPAPFPRVLWSRRCQSALPVLLLLLMTMVLHTSVLSVADCLTTSLPQPVKCQSGLKDVRTRLQSVHFPLLLHQLSMLCVFITSKVFSHASAKKATKRLKGFRLRSIIVVFKWHCDSEGVKISVYCTLRFR